MGALNCVEDCDHEDRDMAITYCGCFRGLYAPHRYESCREEQERLKVEGKWLGKKLKKVVKAFSEILVWAKGESLRICNSETKEKKRRMQFQYDPKSYALNFDDGIEKTDAVFLDFSARYACPIGIGINIMYLELEHSEEA